MKTAIISGSSRGIGAAIAKKAAANGYFVIINYHQHKSAAEQVLEDIGGNGIIYQADVSDFAQVSKMFNYVYDKYKSIDLVVNNAGICASGLLLDMQQSKIVELINVNLLGVINCCKCACKYMLAQHRGKIINISSMWGQVGASCESVYSATKGGIISFTKALAKEIGYNNINVNCVAPGVIDTDMNSALSSQDLSELVDNTPCGRLGNADDVANLVMWLASDDASFVNGQVIGVNGGFCI